MQRDAGPANRDGFGLVLTLLAILVITAGLAAGMSRLEVDARADDATRAAARAYGIAQAGLERFTARRDSIIGVNTRPTAPESARVILPGGYADVVLRQVYGPGGIYLVRSHGVLTAGSRSAERAVARLVAWQDGSMHVEGGWTSLAGIQKQGASGVMDGSDACGQKTAVAGVSVPPGGYTQNGGHDVPSGTPPIQAYPSLDSAKKALHIDWDALVNQGAITPDFTDVPTPTWYSLNPTTYPTILVDQTSYTLPNSGRGLLMVTGNLTMSGNLTWDGIILVGGAISASGTPDVHGAAVSGLNLLLAGGTASASSASGNVTFQYNSCEVSNAARRFSGLRAVPGTWVDNWPLY